MPLSDLLVVVGLVLSASFSIAALIVALRQNWLAHRDLTLTAYSNALQEILAHKQLFREDPDIFEEQLNLRPKLKEWIPVGMDTRTFLTFTMSYWRFSYIHSVMRRWKELGLTEEEGKALGREIKAWLWTLPGFRQVYDSFIVRANNHNPTFLKWLEEEVYSPGSPDVEQEEMSQPEQSSQSAV